MKQKRRGGKEEKKKKKKNQKKTFGLLMENETNVGQKREDGQCVCSQQCCWKFSFRIQGIQKERWLIGGLLFCFFVVGGGGGVWGEIK